MELLLTRPIVIGLAVAGAVLAVLASALQVRGKVSPERARQLNVAGYALMGLSMALFITIGLRGGAS